MVLKRIVKFRILWVNNNVTLISIQQIEKSWTGPLMRFENSEFFSERQRGIQKSTRSLEVITKGIRVIHISQPKS